MATLNVMLQGVQLEGPAATSYTKKTTQKTPFTLVVGIDTLERLDAEGTAWKVLLLDVVYNLAIAQSGLSAQPLTTTSIAHINLALGLLRKDGTEPNKTRGSRSRQH